MRHQYQHDPEIQALLPPLAPDERATLHGLLVGDRECEPLTVLRIEDEKTQVLGDGHNREEICLAEGIPFGTRLKKVPTRAAAIEWVIRNQLGRRNLTDERRAYYIGKEYLNRKNPHGGSTTDVQKLHIGPTAVEVAEENGVSPRTVMNNAAFAQAVDALPPKQKEAVLNGQAHTTKAEVVAKAKGKKPQPCQRCKNIGAPACPKCREAFPKGFREPGDDTEAIEAEKAAARRNGKPTFDDGKVTSAIATLVRLFADRAKALHQEKAAEWKAVREAGEGLLKAWKSWQKVKVTA